jgi:hypothetical protein
MSIEITLRKAIEITKDWLADCVEGGSCYLFPAIYLERFLLLVEQYEDQRVEAKISPYARAGRIIDLLSGIVVNCHDVKPDAQNRIVVSSYYYDKAKEILKV